MPADPETWFSVSEHTFNVNHIVTEEAKLKHVLQYLTGTELSQIKDVITSSDDNRACGEVSGGSLVECMPPSSYQTKIF